MIIKPPAYSIFVCKTVETEVLKVESFELRFTSLYQPLF